MYVWYVHKINQSGNLLKKNFCLYFQIVLLTFLDFQYFSNYFEITMAYNHNPKYQSFIIHIYSICYSKLPLAPTVTAKISQCAVEKRNMTTLQKTD